MILAVGMVIFVVAGLVEAMANISKIREDMNPEYRIHSQISRNFASGISLWIWEQSYT
jgi:hypothetical protein